MNALPGVIIHWHEFRCLPKTLACPVPSDSLEVDWWSLAFWPTLIGPEIKQGHFIFHVHLK